MSDATTSHATPIEPGDREPAAAELRAERYRRALARIADAESGLWGQIAAEALYGASSPRGEP